ncbi:hypothetical protein PC129_g12350 [Phytophthora cactorum]|uniref:Uncharacterized protein n=1 Tax=Phytophthora cactorum TaxID=29920 RepID=A0A8T1K8W2_9STRA|nr:hypothetical protein Pcac1_g16961 [Phytophthora cactorum]KAG2884596.1 hypothetical protein PC114_g20004 [Phytophthora cactorum]KAG2907622.1 hypothetical protein PC117_g20160 [Phytophthora cactorum]KAG2981199.1 hypothetical protein PC118_g10748 [Phytophthora cactorum]KAG3153075.1 hypothetical protein C6341_g16077 [Phytophthora cactorum]
MDADKRPRNEEGEMVFTPRMLDYIHGAREKEARKHEVEKDRLKKDNMKLTEELKRLIRAPQGSLALSEVERHEKELAKQHERRDIVAREEKIDLLNRMAQKDALMAQKDKETQEPLASKDKGTKELLVQKDNETKELLAQKDKETKELLAQQDARMAQKDKDYQEIIEKKNTPIEKKDKDYQHLIEKKEVCALQENRHNQNRLDSAAAFHLRLAYANQARVHKTANVVHDFLTTNQQTLNTYGAAVIRTLPRDFKQPSSLKAVFQVRSGLNADTIRKRSVDDIADTYRPQPVDTKTVVLFTNMADMKGFFCQECGKAVKLVFEEQQLTEEDQYVDAEIAMSEVLTKVRVPAGDRGAVTYLTCRVTDMTSSIDDGVNRLQSRIEEFALDEPDEEEDAVEKIELE